MADLLPAALFAGFFPFAFLAPPFLAPAFLPFLAGVLLGAEALAGEADPTTAEATGDLLIALDLVVLLVTDFLATLLVTLALATSMIS